MTSAIELYVGLSVFAAILYATWIMWPATIWRLSDGDI